MGCSVSMEGILKSVKGVPILGVRKDNIGIG
jgi:hypothetical protein